MSGAFYAAGFEPWDITMSDLLNGAISLHEFRGIAFVGGFSYADVLDSAKGWAASIRFNKPLLKQFQEFYERPDTFSLGVCNGCQLMALLGWVPGPNVGGVLGDNGDPSQPRFIHNESGRFECRFTSVKIEKSPALMFKGMEGNLAPVKYCDDNGNPTEVYPFNLNGSPLGVAAICSPDGRHLAMMPHPERCFLMWQYLGIPRTGMSRRKAQAPGYACSKMLESGVHESQSVIACKFQTLLEKEAILKRESPLRSAIHVCLGGKLIELIIELSLVAKMQSCFATWQVSNLDCVANGISNTNPQNSNLCTLFKPLLLYNSPYCTNHSPLIAAPAPAPPPQQTLTTISQPLGSLTTMAAAVSTVGAVNRAPVNLNGSVGGAAVPSSSFLGMSLKKVNSSHVPKVSSGNFKVVAEVNEKKQTDQDRWKGLVEDISDDQQDITRGKGMVDSLFQAPTGMGTHDPVLSSYEYISQGLRQ
ncbi:UNVERIFIED_CONTAM: putative phosphoribosylformylglycinamidine synthase, chloroplastic/mitochondrial [Sesamum calycinum]|uniref:Phosphoribosylformylglycinamidine synthase, chloroplastic/mitochondrial n=1 Tax=Sesamum calycinum TaxID=2727403 RepID=A0AAW2RRL6_9LAMI